MDPDPQAPTRDALMGLLGPELLAIGPAALARAMRAAGLPDVLARQGAIDDDARRRIDARIGHAARLTTADPTQGGGPAKGETQFWERGGPSTAADALPPAPSPDRAEMSTIDARIGVNGQDHDRRPGDGESRRFTVLKPYRSGGLGVVSIARDEELHREVAYKEIREAYANHADKRSRFIAEAEITGGLEHPGIVPVYALGRDDRGRPFYAMKLIRGKTLKDAVVELRAGSASPAERRLALRELLGRLIDVCDAMQYAHSRGVLHRDLKPANILLGKYGETLVVDWGLAKVLGRASKPRATSEPRPSAIPTPDDPMSDEHPFELPTESEPDETPPGSSVGTPGYMSPEQARGHSGEGDEKDLVGPRSDVYSLGATLYYVLTGRTTIDDRDRVVLLRRLFAGDIPPPRRIDPKVHPALEAICVRALAVDPAERYESPHALADDLKHWLADEPTTAYRDPVIARVGRWVRRHKPLVAGAVMTLIAAVAVLAVTLGIILREKSRADDNLAMAGDAMREVSSILNNDLVYFPKMDQVRARIATALVRIFDEVVRQRPDDLEHRRDAAEVAASAGNLHRLMSHPDEARSAYAKALAHYRGLARRFPDEPSFVDGVVRVLIDRAELERIEGRFAPAEADLREVATIADSPLSAVAPILRARADSVLAASRQEQGNLAEARRLIDRALDVLDAEGTTPRIVATKSIAQALRVKASIARDEGRIDDVEATVARGLRTLADSPIPAGQDPDVDYLGESLAIIRAQAIERDPARRGEAGRLYQGAAVVLEPLVAKYPEVAPYRLALAVALAGCADHGVGGDPIVLIDRSREILERLAEGRGRRVDLTFHLARSLLIAARLERDRGRVVEARALLTRAVVLLEANRQVFPRNTMVLEQLAEARHAIETLPSASDR